MSVCCIYVPHIVESLVESTASVDHFQPRHPDGMHCQTVVAEWAISKTGEDRKSAHTHTCTESGGNIVMSCDVAPQNVVSTL